MEEDLTARWLALIDVTKRYDIELVPPFAPLLPNDDEIGLLQGLKMTRSPCLWNTPDLRHTVRAGRRNAGTIR